MCGIAFAIVQGDDFVNVINSFKENVIRRGPDSCMQEVVKYGEYSMIFFNSLLQMQGLQRRKPILKDSTGNILLWNGEAYFGLDIDTCDNDGAALLDKLGKFHDDKDISTILSSIRGPWALVYYDAVNQVIWCGRDFMGRKSLISRGGFANSLLTITSVANIQNQGSSQFAEMVPGLYRLRLKDLLKSNFLDICPLERFPWLDDVILQLCDYSRKISEKEIKSNSPIASKHAESVTKELLNLLLKSVEDRCTCAAYSIAIEPKEPHFMLLFSGGVDSTLLAALLHKVLPINEVIELSSICFAQGNSPDRLGALDAYAELKSTYPDRDWRFIAINSTYEELKVVKERIVDLLYPSDTIMDFNIGGALWLAARGIGFLIDVFPKPDEAPGIKILDLNYQSKSRVVFLGHGADELFGGYGRHRTKYKNAGWSGLGEELRLDVRRLWQRNFGRDDRIISDHGKESRIPFVDERVIEFALNADLEDLMNLDLPIGVGDKIILRRCLRLLGLSRASERHKRALQFGSRLSKAANKDAFGSNAAANRRHGGKVRIADCNI